MGESAPYGIAFPIQQQYVCESGCHENLFNDPYYCGYQGSCNKETDHCHCSDLRGGDYCEFGVDERYAKPLAQTLLLNYNASAPDPFGRDAYPYSAKYWSRNDYNDSDLYGVFQYMFESSTSPASLEPNESATDASSTASATVPAIVDLVDAIGNYTDASRPSYETRL